MKNFTQNEWMIGYGSSITGPTCPKCEGATVNETYDNSTFQIITTPDIPSGSKKEMYNSVIAILPIRSGTEEQDANAKLIVNAPKMYNLLNKIYNVISTTIYMLSWIRENLLQHSKVINQKIVDLDNLKIEIKEIISI